jgi:Family of unknown function (DUF6298)
MSLLTSAATFSLAFALSLHAAPKNQSPIISVSKDQRLAYDGDERGNRIPDFSNCGYAGGDRQIPDAPVRVAVEPKPGDGTPRIQKAIDYVASLPVDSNGLRGVVLLLKGRHEILGGLQITNSGIVLRGQGMGDDGTILVAAGLDRRTLIRITGKNDRATKTSASWQIKDDYVPVGATSFHLTDASGLKVGDTINVIRPCTKEWIDQLGATEFGGGIGDWRLTWKPGSRDLVWNRVVTAIGDDLVTVDAPITTAIENPNLGRRRGDESQTEKKEKLESPYVVSYNWPGRISNIGIENLQLESTFDASNPKDENHSWCAITMENAEDVWVRQVTAKHFAGSMVAIYESCKWVTVEDCLSLAPVSEDGGYRRHTFFTMGQMTLFLRCYAERGRHDFSVGHCAAGPNAFVQCEANLALDDSGGIESWSSGTLFDNVRIDGNALTLGYRGPNGQGAGWSAANSVLWNCNASQIRCQNPPGAKDWSFGSWGEFDGEGVWRSSNNSVEPMSLFAAQLAERIGSEPAKRVQLMPRSTRESSNPTVAEAAELIAASRQPAPQLADYILAAAKRNPIPSEVSDAKRVEEISSGSSRGNEAPTSNRQSDQSLLTSAATKKIIITNGWITCDGKLLIGGGMDVAWWRGNVRPSEAPSFEPALTRFVPGRIGRGFTDDLDAIADEMVAEGRVTLDQHYGLWYERRRDDHERVRRVTGDVWPPFFEQPFARSGQGTAWDGLSKYDLTKFNPWYWSRLKQFADVCDERGLALFNENYFQHNIIEAGAHWVDCPWRTANNINETGFPEPPPFAGDKRIFMAEQFYDVTNPVRRALHRGFIRQNLDNFTNNANVIQFTSAEFTGPLHFVQFWLDTIGDWKRETRGKAIIALAAPKDVQDAILADDKRNALVDVIAFRYWWVTDKGIYAPKGGQNLAPRQFQRQWKGGTPSDLNLATMAAEYHQRFPNKPVIAASEQGSDMSHCGWAYLCAGGSIPNLPTTTDAELLAAIPRMQPWKADANAKFWVLRETGKGFMIYSGSGSAVAIDLSGEQGKFDVKVVSESGAVTEAGQQVEAGHVATLKKTTNGRIIFWLTKN